MNSIIETPKATTDIARAVLTDNRFTTRLLEVTLFGHIDPSHRLTLLPSEDVDAALLRHTGMVPVGPWSKAAGMLRQTVDLALHALACPTCVDGCDCEAGASVDCGHYGCWSAAGAARVEECAFAAVLRR